MTVVTTPQFEVADAVRLAQEIYGLTAVASPLPSERDQNFALRTATGHKFVLKISKSDEERSVLEFQNAVLKHLARSTLRFALPRLLSSSADEDIVTTANDHGQTCFARLMTWLDGEILVRVQPHSESLLASLGFALADVDRALQDFSHPAMHRELRWDVKRAGNALQHLPLLSAEQRSIVRRFMYSWGAVDWNCLRHSAIHGDANDYNVLVREDRVAGFLDFGDTVYSAVACDLAIALAYAMLEKPEPLAAAIPVIRAYHSQFPLAGAEIEALYPLITARLCMSLCYAAHNAHAKRGDAYQLVTAGPAWSLLQQLAAIPRDAVKSAFRDACFYPRDSQAL